MTTFMVSKVTWGEVEEWPGKLCINTATTTCDATLISGSSSVYTGHSSTSPHPPLHLISATIARDPFMSPF